MDIELYPYVTADSATWPVLARITTDDGQTVLAYDPQPYAQKRDALAWSPRMAEYPGADPT